MTVHMICFEAPAPAAVPALSTVARIAMALDLMILGLVLVTRRRTTSPPPPKGR